MNEFTNDWLQLRRAADQKARNTKIIKLFCNWLHSHTQENEPVKLVDMAAGSGAFLHDLSGHIGLNRQQNWLLLDNNPHLLNVAAHAAVPFPQIKVATRLW